MTSRSPRSRSAALGRNRASRITGFAAAAIAAALVLAACAPGSGGSNDTSSTNNAGAGTTAPGATGADGSGAAGSAAGGSGAAGSGAAGSGAAGSGAAGGAAAPDPSTFGDVTLTVWDQEVRGGQDQQIKKLNEEFQAKYPNIKIKRVSRSFDDLTKTLRLALTGNEAPDVVQANNTRSQMGEFVKAKQIINLDSYAKTYGWDQRYPQSVRNASSYSADGKTFGSGSLYGLPQVGELIGVYYNTDKLAALGIQPPKTWAEFDAALAAAKAKGEQPLVLGNLDKWPAIHVFGVVQGRYTQAEQIRQLGFGQPGTDWNAEGNVKAAQQLKDWVDKGYLSKDVNAQGYDPAWQGFSKGTGVFLIAGSWLQSDLSKAMKDKVKFMLPPPSEADGGKVVTTGATGLPFAITSKAKNPDAAAAYINFLTNENAMKVLAETGNLPIVDTAKQKAPDALGTDVFTAFDTVSTDDGLVPYLDWATPTMSDTLGAALQDLLAGRTSPEDTMKTLQQDYSDFTSGQ
ncbi:ABC transporter substrate-binding protein [Nakamurella aerolata]|uniref:Extracellular solute-binding protein n=1 Tax=Nakamurella aerolata TaxID=1656892 RepID=A0A849ACH0_9ACTN|nr:extracellular solute-binding protein [Nakamurella aerolata]NNG36848.1 extracellular solute-binding protein [Nakamurella aerolata]